MVARPGFCLSTAADQGEARWHVFLLTGASRDSAGKPRHDLGREELNRDGLQLGRAVPAYRRTQVDVLHTEFVAQLADEAGHRLGTADERCIAKEMLRVQILILGLRPLRPGPGELAGQALDEGFRAPAGFGI